MKTTLTCLVHGEPGTGKSRLGGTAPAPRLIIDLEGRARYLPGKKIQWDPRQGGPPECDGTWDTCIVVCQDFETLGLVYQWLASGQHCFVSVIVDSLMEAQKRCIDLVAGTNQMQTQDWGTLLRKLEALVRSYRDLTLKNDNTTQVVCFIVGSVSDEGVQRPLLQGQLKTTVPYYLDCVGYLYMAPQQDGSLMRCLMVQPQPGFVAKDGTGFLPGPVVAIPDNQPNLEHLFQHVKNGQEGVTA